MAKKVETAVQALMKDEYAYASRISLEVVRNQEGSDKYRARALLIYGHVMVKTKDYKSAKRVYQEVLRVPGALRKDKDMGVSF